MSNRKYTRNPLNWKHPLLTIRKHCKYIRKLCKHIIKYCKYIRKHRKCASRSVDNSRTKLENFIDEKYDQVAIKYLKEKILNEVKQQFSPSNQGDKINAELVKSWRKQMENLQSEICFLLEEMKEKNTLLRMIIHSKGSPREMTLSSSIYRQCQCKNASEKTHFHEQNMLELFQEQSPNPSNRGASKDYHTDLITIPPIKHPTSFPVN